MIFFCEDLKCFEQCFSMTYYAAPHSKNTYYRQAQPILIDSSVWRYLFPGIVLKEEQFFEATQELLKSITLFSADLQWGTNFLCPDAQYHHALFQ